MSRLSEARSPCEVCAFEETDGLPNDMLVVARFSVLVLRGLPYYSRQIFHN
jgi:hypothetical protein